MIYINCRKREKDIKIRRGLISDLGKEETGEKNRISSVYATLEKEFASIKERIRPFARLVSLLLVLGFSGSLVFGLLLKGGLGKFAGVEGEVAACHVTDGFDVSGTS